MNLVEYAPLGIVVTIVAAILWLVFRGVTRTELPLNKLPPPRLHTYLVNYMENGRVMEVEVKDVESSRVTNSGNLLVFVDIDDYPLFVVSLDQYISHIRKDSQP